MSCKKAQKLQINKPELLVGPNSIENCPEAIVLL